MTRKEKLALRQHLSTRQLMGMQGIASHGITTSNSELVFFLIRPDNLSVLSSEGIRARVTALANLLRAEPAVELLVVDSRESFQRNKEFYQKRLEEETTPAIRKLLIEDMRHLDEILSSSASAREFVLILRRDLKSDMSEGTLRQLEKGTMLVAMAILPFPIKSRRRSEWYQTAQTAYQGACRCTALHSLRGVYALSGSACG